MLIESICSPEEITALAKDRFREERSLNHLEGWFLAREIAMECDKTFADDPDCIRIGKTLIEVMKRIPLTLGDYHVFAGTQDDAFARSYALINPSFEVKSFEGYCDPVAVFSDIDPIGDITAERIEVHHCQKYRIGQCSREFRERTCLRVNNADLYVLSKINRQVGRKESPVMFKYDLKCSEMFFRKLSRASEIVAFRRSLVNAIDVFCVKFTGA